MHVSSENDSPQISAEWADRRITVPLDVVDRKDLVEAVREEIRTVRHDDDEFVTVVVPEYLRRRGVGHFVGGRRELLLKAAMLFEPQVVVTNVPTLLAVGDGPAPSGPIAPTRNVAIVLVSGVHNATLRALDYARAIRPTELRAVTFNVDDLETEKIMRDWANADTDAALEILDSPYREVAGPLLRLVRQIRSGAQDTVVTVIVPEFVVAKWYHQFLHNQTALGIKASLLFEPGVVVTSVPFHLR